MDDRSGTEPETTIDGSSDSNLNCDAKIIATSTKNPTDSSIARDEVKKPQQLESISDGEEGYADPDDGTVDEKQSTVNILPKVVGEEGEIDDTEEDSTVPHERKKSKKHSEKHKKSKKSKKESRKRSRSRSRGSASPPRKQYAASRSPTPPRWTKTSSRDDHVPIRIRHHMDREQQNEKDAAKDMYKNPFTLQNKCNQIIQLGENQAAQVNDEELRTCIKEAIALGNSLQRLFGKREILKRQMEDIMGEELETIKSINAELPRHMQGVLKFENGRVFISSEGTGVVPPQFGMMPPGLFEKLGPPPPGFPPMNFPPPVMGPNGILQPPPGFPMSMFQPPPFSQPPPVTGATETADKETKPVSEITSNPPPPLPVNFNQPPPTLPSGTLPPPPMPDFSRPPPMSMGVSVPEPQKASTDDLSKSTQLPFRLAVPEKPMVAPTDISKNLSSILTNVLKAQVTQQQQHTPVVPFGSGSPAKSNIPMQSLMSLNTTQPLHLGTVRLSNISKSSQGQNKGQSD